MTQVIPADGGLQTPVDLDALAASAGIVAEHVIPYGRDVAKIDLRALDPGDQANDGASGAHYVVVTAITPTPFGSEDPPAGVGRRRRAVRYGVGGVSRTVIFGGLRLRVCGKPTRLRGHHNIVSQKYNQTPAE